MVECSSSLKNISLPRITLKSSSFDISSYPGVVSASGLSAVHSFFNFFLYESKNPKVPLKQSWSVKARPDKPKSQA
jgi:hypothetical protein